MFRRSDTILEASPRLGVVRMTWPEEFLVLLNSPYPIHIDEVIAAAEKLDDGVIGEVTFRKANDSGVMPYSIFKHSTVKNGEVTTKLFLGGTKFRESYCNIQRDIEDFVTKHLSH